MRHNIALLIEYDGTDFFGYQRQKDQRTVQGVLEAALEKLFAERIGIAASGRTDAGVHALGQVVSLRMEHDIPAARLPAALNSLLPQDVVVKGAARVAPDFHARYSARGKIYRYYIMNRRTPSALLGRYAAHIPTPLDTERMRYACTFLQGRHDFKSFMSSGSPVGSSVRTLFRLQVKALPQDIIAVTAFADGFLYQMVRNIVGTLIEVGRGRRNAEDMGALLAFRDRTAAAPPAQPQGLYLLRVNYPAGSIRWPDHVS